MIIAGQYHDFSVKKQTYCMLLPLHGEPYRYYPTNTPTNIRSIFFINHIFWKLRRKLV